MTEERTRAAIAALVLIGFYGFIALVLMGFVSIENPEMAKMVGAIFGFMGGLVTPIVMRYFKNGGGDPKP
jgi:membrane associated rhomboid family serine protease